jgi:hypothetical protein
MSNLGAYITRSPDFVKRKCFGHTDTAAQLVAMLDRQMQFERGILDEHS